MSVCVFDKRLDPRGSLGSPLPLFSGSVGMVAGFLSLVPSSPFIAPTSLVWGAPAWASSPHCLPPLQGEACPGYSGAASGGPRGRARGRRSRPELWPNAQSLREQGKRHSSPALVMARPFQTSAFTPATDLSTVDPL